MLAHRHRRWANIEPALVERLVLHDQGVSRLVCVFHSGINTRILYKCILDIDIPDGQVGYFYSIYF